MVSEEPGIGPTSGRMPGFLLPLVVAGGLGVVGIFAWAAVATGVWHDDGAYLLLGKSLADGEGLRYSQVAGSPPGAKFPPHLSPFPRTAVETRARGGGARDARVFLQCVVRRSEWGAVRGLSPVTELLNPECGHCRRSVLVASRSVATGPGASIRAALPGRPGCGTLDGLSPGGRAHMAPFRGIPGCVRIRLSHPNHGAGHRDRGAAGLVAAGPDSVGGAERRRGVTHLGAVADLVGPRGGHDSRSPT